MESTRPPHTAHDQAADTHSIFLNLKSPLLGAFDPLFQEGVQVLTRVNCSVSEFLLGRLGVTPEYVKERIQTLFLDGRPVDDEDSARMADGAVLALSGAMPGLAGATLRKGGYFSSLRYQISHAAGTGPSLPARGTVTVKLFNVVLKELAPLLLSKGVLVPGKRIGELLVRQGKAFWEGCDTLEVDGRPADRDGILGSQWPEHPVVLTVETAK